MSEPTTLRARGPRRLRRPFRRPKLEERLAPYTVTQPPRGGRHAPGRIVSQRKTGQDRRQTARSAPARLTLRIPEVAEQLGVATSTVQRWTASGALAHYKVGGVVLIRPDDVDTYLAGHREGGRVLKSVGRRGRSA